MLSKRLSYHPALWISLNYYSATLDATSLHYVMSSHIHTAIESEIWASVLYPKNQLLENEPPWWFVFFTSRAIVWQPPLRKRPIMCLRQAMFADCPLMPSACETAETPSNCCFSRCWSCWGGSPCTYTWMHTALCCAGLGCQLKLSTQQSASPSCWFPVGPGEGGREGGRVRLLWTQLAIQQLGLDCGNSGVYVRSCLAVFWQAFVLFFLPLPRLSYGPLPSLPFSCSFRRSSPSPFLAPLFFLKNTFHPWAFLPLSHALGLALSFLFHRVIVITGSRKLRKPLLQICSLWVIIISG